MISFFKSQIAMTVFVAGTQGLTMKKEVAEKEVKMAKAMISAWKTQGPRVESVDSKVITMMRACHDELLLQDKMKNISETSYKAAWQELEKMERKVNEDLDSIVVSQKNVSQVNKYAEILENSAQGHYHLVQLVLQRKIKDLTELVKEMKETLVKETFGNEKKTKLRSVLGDHVKNAKECLKMVEKKAKEYCLKKVEKKAKEYKNNRATNNEEIMELEDWTTEELAEIGLYRGRDGKCRQIKDTKGKGGLIFLLIVMSLILISVILTQKLQ